MVKRTLLIFGLLISLLISSNTTYAQSTNNPYPTFYWIVDSTHTISAISPLITPCIGTNATITWTFLSWSDNGTQTHTVVAPSVPAAYTAIYNSSGDCPSTKPITGSVTPTGVVNVTSLNSPSTFTNTTSGNGVACPIGASCVEIKFCTGPIPLANSLMIDGVIYGCSALQASSSSVSSSNISFIWILLLIIAIIILFGIVYIVKRKM